MHQFKDSKEAVWDVQINVSQLKAVKSLAGVDVLALVNGGDVSALQDPVALCNVLYALCRKQAGELKVSDEEFGERMYGDVIDRATEAFLAELVDFFPSQRRSFLREALEADRKVQDLILQKAKEAQRSPEEVADEAWEKVRPRPLPEGPPTSNGSSGSAPARSPSTPVPSP